MEGGSTNPYWNLRKSSAENGLTFTPTRQYSQRCFFAIAEISRAAPRNLARSSLIEPERILPRSLNAAPLDIRFLPAPRLSESESALKEFIRALIQLPKINREPSPLMVRYVSRPSSDQQQSNAKYLMESRS